MMKSCSFVFVTNRIYLHLSTSSKTALATKDYKLLWGFTSPSSLSSAYSTAPKSGDFKREKIGDASSIYRIKDNSNKALVLLFPWLFSKQRHFLKYMDMYFKRGYDVLVTEVKPMHLLLPTTGTQKVAEKVTSFLEKQEQYQHFFLHSFSVGGYMWGECLVNMEQHPERREQILPKFVGQVYDSAVDFYNIPIGVAKATTNNTFIQALISSLIKAYLEVMQSKATKHYIHASHVFHYRPLPCPVLAYFSKTDPVGTAESNDRMVKIFSDVGLQTRFKCWDSSQHVSHFYKHTQEYKNILNDFMDRVEKQSDSRPNSY